MNLQYLRSFYVIVKANSISKAAKMLYLTQPGLSMQLQALEKELDVSLLVRSNKGVELTDEGRVVFEYADKILSLEDNIERDLGAMKTSKPHIFISSCKVMGEYALPCSLYLYQHQHKDVIVDIQVANSDQVVKDLIKHTSNIGIVQEDNLHPKVISKKFFSSKMLLVSSSPLVDKKSFSLKDMVDLPLILLEEGCDTRRIVLEALDQAGVPTESLNITYEPNSYAAIQSLVMAGNGFSFLPEFIIQRELYTSLLHTIPVEDFEIACDFYFIHRKGHVFPPHEQDLIDFLSSPKRNFC